MWVYQVCMGKLLPFYTNPSLIGLKMQKTTNNYNGGGYRMSHMQLQEHLMMKCEHDRLIVKCNHSLPAYLSCTHIHSEPVSAFSFDKLPTSWCIQQRIQCNLACLLQKTHMFSTKKKKKDFNQFLKLCCRTWH